MEVGTLTVGKLAEHTGISIRTLHYYDEIGLLNPSLHTEGGYRVYTSCDLVRLQHLLMLRQLGFSLAEVRERLDAPDFSLPELIRAYIARLREQIELQQGLCQRLETMLAHLCVVSEIGADKLLKTIEVMISTGNRRAPEPSE